MKVDTLIRHRSEEKEIRLSGELVMTKEAWEQRGAVYHGSLGAAAKESWYTVRNCELMGLPVTEEEFSACKNFAMYQDCYAENCIVVDGKQKRPCLPVFYRDKKDIWVRVRRKLPDGSWSGPIESGPLSTVEKLMKAEPGTYKICGYLNNSKK